MSRRRWGAPFPCGVMFHRFRVDATLEWQGALTPDELEGLLLAVGLERIRTPAEWRDRLRAGHLRPGDVCLTFDDGLRCQFDIAKPVLDGHGLKAFWFVYTCIFEGQAVTSELYSYAAAHCGGMDALAREFLAACPSPLRDALRTEGFREYAARMRRLAPFYSDDDISFRYLRNEESLRPAFEERMNALLAQRRIDLDELAASLWMTEAHVRSLADEGHEIGLHSHDHPLDMRALPAAEQRRQYVTNATILEAVTGIVPASVAYPLGSYNDDSLAAVRELGVTCGFLPHAFGDARGINPTPLELARLDPAEYFTHAPHRHRHD